MTPALRLVEVVKAYGKRVALGGFTATIARGSVTGVVGPNGAGKTTCFGIVAGVIRPDAGHVDVLGRGPFDPRVHRGRLALLPSDAALSPHSPVRDLFVHYARLQGMSARDAAVDSDRVLDLLALREQAALRLGALSHGMRRRVAVGQALLGDPELVLLDEPTSGLDPDLVVRMRELFAAQRGRRTMVISSHVLADLEAVCDHVVFVEGGRVVRSGALADVTGRRNVVRITLDERTDVSAIRTLGLNVETDDDERVLVASVPVGEDVARLNAQLLAALLAQGARILEVRCGDSLESAWMRRDR